MTTKLKWNLFTKVIKRPSEEAWVWIDRVSNKKRSASASLERVENVCLEANIYN